ncbi:MAG: hypothetical protein FJ137_17050, partial [Deltaproteobacteria bacterium]|nr:hypothetical protein [Deltaproteobacteria bacterium]
MTHPHVPRLPGLLVLVVVGSWVLAAAGARAERPPRAYIPASVQLELRSAESRFESALAQDCAPDKCFSNGCVYVSHTTTDLPRDTTLPGLDGERGPGSVPVQDTLTEVRCGFSHEKTVNTKDVAALARRLEQRLSRGWLRVSVTTTELAPVPRRLSDALYPPDEPEPAPKKADDEEDAALEPPPPPPPPPSTPPPPGTLTSEEALRDLWETLLPHFAWMAAILLLTLAIVVLIWAGRRLGAPSLDEKVLLAQLAHDPPPAPSLSTEPVGPGSAAEPSAEDDDFLKAQEDLWTGRLSSASADSDTIVANLLQEWLRAGNFPMLARALLVFGDRVATALASDSDLAVKKLEFAAYFRDVDESTLPSRAEFFRRLNQHAMASTLLAQDDVKPYRTLREDFGSSGVVDLMEQLPARAAALLFALMPRDSQSDVARLLPQPLRLATAEHLLASTRMARAESEFIFG